MEIIYTTKIGKQLYCDLLSKMNHKELLSGFAGHARIVENGVPCENDSYERILLEFMIIAEKEEVAFSQENFGSIINVWKDIFTRIPLGYRFSGAKRLSPDECGRLKDFITILDDSDFQQSEFATFLKLEISLAPYRMIRPDIPVVLGKSYLPVAGKRTWLGKTFPKGLSLAK
ncbi:MAG: hypothetical protein JWM20_614 [Patescibacteria group bacterium]|nr:hypothetical protein [Patescibacteria group bacterium]